MILKGILSVNTYLNFGLSQNCKLQGAIFLSFIFDQSLWTKLERAAHQFFKHPLLCFVLEQNMGLDLHEFLF